jgi:hypothetical protein
MTPDQLEQVIAWTFPRRTRAKKSLGIVSPFLKGIGLKRARPATLYSKTRAARWGWTTILDVDARIAEALPRFASS